MTKEEDKQPQTFVIDVEAEGGVRPARSVFEDEPDPAPADDGRYYLVEGPKAVDFAQAAAARGVTTYCALCKASLFVSRAAVVCTRNQRHFGVHIHLRDPDPEESP